MHSEPQHTITSSLASRASHIVVTAQQQPQLQSNLDNASSSPNMTSRSVVSLNSNTVTTTSIHPTPIVTASTGRKSKKSNGIPSKDELEINFLKNELAAAQARIVQLDVKVEDKDKRIAILKARLKYFEDKENDTTYRRYFPEQDNRNLGRNDHVQCTNDRSSIGSRSFMCNPIHNCTPQFVQCPSHHMNTPPSCMNNYESQTKLLALSDSIEHIKEQVTGIINDLSRIDGLVRNKQPNQHLQQEQIFEADTIDQEEEISSLDENASMASLESCIPDDPINQIDLN